MNIISLFSSSDVMDLGFKQAGFNRQMILIKMQ